VFGHGLGHGWNQMLLGAIRLPCMQHVPTSGEAVHSILWLRLQSGIWDLNYSGFEALNEIGNRELPLE